MKIRGWAAALLGREREIAKSCASSGAGAHVCAVSGVHGEVDAHTVHVAPAAAKIHSHA